MRNLIFKTVVATIHPPMTATDLNGGPPIFVPGGEKPAPGIAP